MKKEGTTGAKFVAVVLAFVILTGDGSNMKIKTTVDDWDCYMGYGFGGMFHWKGVCLGVDFPGKAFDDDLDVDTTYVNGSIGNAKW